MHRLFLFGFGSLAFMLASVAPAVSEGRTAGQVVEQLNGTLLKVMKNAEQLGYKGRYETLEPVIKSVYDLPFLAKFSVGRYWKAMGAEAQSQWVGKFSDYSIATYAARFNGYSGESFTLESEQPLKGNKVIVKSLLIRPDEKAVEFDYILSQGDTGKWRIINILVDGVSDLALKRAEYSNILSKGGFDALMDKMSEEIADDAKGKAG